MPDIAAVAWIRLLLAVLGGVAGLAFLVYAVVFLATAMAGADAGTSGDYGAMY